MVDCSWLMKMPIFPRILLVIPIAIAAMQIARAESPSVTAVLSSSEALVGQPVQLQIKVTGLSGARPPDQISVDGLDIRFSGQSQSIEGRNFKFTYSFVYNYTVMPEKAGRFKIPPQTISAGGTSLRTPELALNVTDAPNRTTRSTREKPSISTQELAFSELIVTKESAYVGEMVPVQMRIGINVRARAQLTKPPEVTGQGFTTQKLVEPQRTFETIDGRTYQVLTYKTAIAAARTGKFSVGPVEATAVFELPRRSGSGRSPFDIFNMDDPFSDPFFSDPFMGRFEQKEITLKSQPATLEVKPLPPKAPAEFTGAVGSFTMTADANPKSAQVGDPLTVTATISGRGNFDRVEAPALSEERGWHKYPPSSKFTQNDDVGFSGSKVFETVVSPNEKKQNVPPLIFSYFDPVKENYVTLRSDAIPVRIEGGVASPTPGVVAAAPAASGLSPSPALAQKPQDILYQINEWPAVTQSFTPVYLQRSFWLAQLGPFFALLGLIGWKWRRARMGDREAQRIARLHQEAVELGRKMRHENLSPQEYFSQAARAVQIKTALVKNVDPNSVDADAAVATFELEEPMRQRLHELFQRSDELRYSGGQNGQETVSAEHRRDIAELMETLRV